MSYRDRSQHEPASSGSDLQASRTPFVGRRDELGQLDAKFREGASLVTLTGAPGAGKTRLAREYGMERRHNDSEVLFCSLSTAESETDVVASLAETLGVTLEASDSDTSLEQRVAHALVERDDALVILDNFEQLANVADELVAYWLDETSADLLVTSRERLGVVGEHCVELGPLTESDAIDLFEARAQMLRPDFELDEQLRETTAKLVRRLDGLPLALELAAGRIRTLPPGELLDRLDDRFQLLQSRDPVENRRDRTLEAAIEWSWELLDDRQRDVLRQTTVFRGGFSLRAAETVIELDDAAWVGDLLESLVRKSLLYSEPSRTDAGRVRFRLYESIRAYIEQTEGPPSEAVRDRHAAHYTDAGETWARELDTEDGEDALERLHQESSNLEAAFEASLQSAPRRGAELGLILDRLLRLAGPLSTHATVVERLCEAATTAGDPELEARAHLARGRLESVRGDLESARSDCEAATDLAETAELTDVRALASFTLGELAQRRGNLTRAAEHLERTRRTAHDEDWRALERLALACLAACAADREANDRALELLDAFETTAAGTDLRRECRAVQRVAYVHYYLGNFAEQRSANQKALDLARRVSDRKLEGLALQGLGDSAFALGDYGAALERYADALELHRELGNLHYEGVLLGNLGTVLHRRSETEEARRRYEQALEIHRRTGAKPYEATVTFALGTLYFELGETSDARRLVNRARELHASIEGYAEDSAAATWTLGWIALARGEGSSARDAFEAARERFRSVETEEWAQLAELGTDLVRALAEADSGDPLELAPRPDRSDTDPLARDIRALLANFVEARSNQADDLYSISEGDEDRPPLFERSLYGRVATLALEQLLQSSEGLQSSDVSPPARPDPKDADLTVGPEGRWFRLDSDQTGDLRRRGALRRILHELTERHLSNGEALDVYDMFDVGWPDQEIDPDNAADRVYWAVRELRKAGLDDLLQTTDAGYLLDPDLSIARSDAATPD